MPRNSRSMSSTPAVMSSGARPSITGPLDGAGMPHLVDLDGDEDLDILMVRSGNLAVYRNDGEGNFEGCMYAEDWSTAQWPSATWTAMISHRL